MTAVDVGIPGRPNTDALVDRFGRVARDLRISVTEKCSLRCTYCMPEQGLPSLPAGAVLTASEIARLVSIAATRLGVREVRFTGGEPLVRPDMIDIVSRCAAAAPTVKMAMTTNGIGLDTRARALAEAGLGRVNISLDTVDRDHFTRLTRRDRLPAVLAGIDAAVHAGLTPVKINAVLMPETLDGAATLLDWCLERSVDLRFIEQMPLDADHTWAREKMVTASDLIAALSPVFDLTPAGRDDASAPAETWSVARRGRVGADGRPHAEGTVGIIASVTRSFCDSCDRTRLTAEGTVRSCLFSDAETDLREALRSGADDEAIASLWRAAMWAKPAGHGMDAAGFAPPTRTMGAIGG